VEEGEAGELEVAGFCLMAVMHVYTSLLILMSLCLYFLSDFIRLSALICSLVGLAMICIYVAVPRVMRVASTTSI